MRLLVLPCFVLLVGLTPALQAAPPVDYARDIKPILSNSCYACHGPDESKRKAGLRLDDRANALKHDAFIVGKGSESEIVRRILSTDASEVMPPPASKKPAITAAQAELLKAWVDQGAKYDQHWAYVPPQKVAPPITQSGNAIDAFINAGLKQQGFTAVPETDRRTLIRRLAFDLIGLPPTPEEVEAFVADASPDAYEKLVDRLLASKHFGERMAMYWLDLVRYADTAGYHSDNHRDVALYRDYVIEAFNRNKGFDQFTLEQLAGDLLPDATPEQRIASGYNRLLQTTEEGGAQAKEYTAKYLADRVRNASSVWMAGTLGCAECHNHKFDPFTARDFYRFGAFFADVQETAVGRQQQMPVPTPQQAARLEELQKQIAAVKADLAAEHPELQAALMTWVTTTREQLKSNAPIWQLAKPTKLDSAGKQTLTIQDDLTILASGKNPARDTYTITLPATLPKITGLRLEALTHPSFPNQGHARGNGNFVLTEFEVLVQATANEAPQPIKLLAKADYEQASFPIANATDGNAGTGWAGDGHVANPKSRAAAFVFDKPIKGGDGVSLIVRMKHDSQFPQHNIGHFRLALTGADAVELGEQGLPANVLEAVRSEQPTPTQSKLLMQHYRTFAPELNARRTKLTGAEAEEKALRGSFPQTLVTVSMSQPRVVRILPRGNWLDDTGEIVTPSTPSFLPELKVEGRRATRLDLAKWLIAPENPLTARVFVNRMWKLMYGRGLVSSLEDFGSQGTLPSHPELLDFLATEFVASKWDVKQLLKQMALSQTYRRASTAPAQVVERDPYNHWLARQNRFRLDAEMVRDNALSVSGLLRSKVGGGSVRPYQPAGYWSFLNFPRREWQADSGDDQYRRGLYTYWCRSFLHPSMAAFDAPSREECTVERSRSSTPLQALVLLNDPSHVEAARVFAERLLREGGDTIDAKLNHAFMLAVSRPIRDAEKKLLTALYEKHHKEYEADATAAKALINLGEAPVPQGMALADLAAWTSVTRVILNLHETITRN